jgi:hypothetical protein
MEAVCIFVLRKRVLRLPRVKDSSRETKLEMRSGRILRLAIHFFLEAESVFEERKASVGISPGVREPIRLLCGVGFNALARVRLRPHDWN